MPLAKVIVSTMVPLPPELAWKAYTDAQAITQWNFANDDWHCPSADVDVRIGGKHLARMEAKDGSFGFDYEGTYAEVAPPHAVTLVMTDGRKSRTTFEACSEGSVVTTTFDAETENDVDMQRAGWQAILDNYRKYAESIA